MALVLLNAKVLNLKQAEAIAAYDWLSCPGRCGRTLRTRNAHGLFCLNIATCNAKCNLPAQHLNKELPCFESLKQTSKRAESIGKRLYPQIQNMLSEMNNTGTLRQTCGGHVYTFICN